MLSASENPETNEKLSALKISGPRHLDSAIEVWT